MAEHICEICPCSTPGTTHCPCLHTRGHHPDCPAPHFPDRTDRCRCIFLAVLDGAHPRALPERQSPIPDATKSGGMVQRYRPAPTTGREADDA